MGGRGGGVSSGRYLRRTITPAAHAAIERRGREIRDLSNEHLSAYDRSGKEILSLEGDETSINITASQLRAMKDTDVTHNHPGYGGTFSWDDLDTLVRGKLNSLSAVDAVRQYTLERKTGIMTNRNEFVTRYKSFSGKIDTETKNRIEKIKVNAINHNWSDAKIGDEFDKVNDWADKQARMWLKQHSGKYGYTYREREI